MQSPTTATAKCRRRRRAAKPHQNLSVTLLVSTTAQANNQQALSFADLHVLETYELADPQFQKADQRVFWALPGALVTGDCWFKTLPVTYLLERQRIGGSAFRATFRNLCFEMNFWLLRQVRSTNVKTPPYRILFSKQLWDAIWAHRKKLYISKKYEKALLSSITDPPSHLKRSYIRDIRKVVTPFMQDGICVLS